MTVVSHLTLRRFRLFEELSLDPGSRLNFFCGDNGAGKTSLLEALHVLGRGRSFRATHLSELAQRPRANGWAVDATVGESGHHWRARWQDSHLALSVNETAQTRVQAIQGMPLLTLLPGLHSVVEGGALERRALIDWAMFHVEHRFMHHWQRYRRALEQRNRALRSGDIRSIQAWHLPMAAEAVELHALRKMLCDAVSTRLEPWSVRLGLELRPRLTLHPGWPEELSLNAVLDQQIESDIRLGYTRLGPHRAELRLESEGQLARRHFSRGQQKQLVLALSLSLLEVIQQRTGVWPILSIDDWNAELSPRSSEAFWSVLKGYPGQSWITGFEPPEGQAAGGDVRMFHVEQRGVRQW